MTKRFSILGGPYEYELVGSWEASRSSNNGAKLVNYPRTAKQKPKKRGFWVFATD